jgi:hypothetical protein
MSELSSTLLVRHGIVRADQVAAAHALQQREGGSFGECLVRIGAVDEQRLVEFYHKRLMIPRVDAQRLTVVSPKVIALVPFDMALEFRVLPIDVDSEGTLTLAMADPTNNHAVDEVGFFTDRFVVRAVAPESAIREAIQLHYGIPVPGPRRTAETQPAPERTTQQQPPTPERQPTEDFAGAPDLELDVDIDVELGGGADAPSSARRRTTTAPRIRTEPTQSPPRDAARPSESADEPVLLTRVKITEETPLPTPAPPGPDEAEGADEPILLTRPKALMTPEHPVGRVDSDGEEPRRRRQRDTLPGLVPPSPDPPLAALRRARSRDEVAGLVLDYFALLTGRAILFVVKRALLVGHDARGSGIDRESVKELAVHMEASSIFRDVVASRLPYRGPLPMAPTNRAFAQALGGVRGEILLMPVTIRERIVAVVYADGIEGPLPDAALHATTREAGLAYERIILDAKAAGR